MKTKKLRLFVNIRKTGSVVLRVLLMIAFGLASVKGTQVTCLLTIALVLSFFVHIGFFDSVSPKIAGKQKHLMKIRNTGTSNAPGNIALGIMLIFVVLEFFIISNKAFAIGYILSSVVSLLLFMTAPVCGYLLRWKMIPEITD